MNVVVLQGRLSREPRARELQSGAWVVAYEVTTRDQAGKADTVPVVTFSEAEPNEAFTGGDEVVVVGRVRRRFFASSGVTRSSTEVLADAVVPAKRRSRVAKALESARLALSADSAPAQ
jgi:single-stranded DNA-binding protein